jgi:hypothetical protein
MGRNLGSLASGSVTSSDIGGNLLKENGGALID